VLDKTNHHVISNDRGFSRALTLAALSESKGEHYSGLTSLTHNLRGS
jgi:hypothetical protein